MVVTRMNRIIEIDTDNLIAVVEPGVVTGKFQKEVETKYPNRCAKCGGTDIRRQSSQMPQDQGQQNQGPLSRKAMEHEKDMHALSGTL